MTLHKLTAGDGYTYLTRQVAAADSTERGYTSLGDYYAAKGESPGRWTGRGLASLGTSGTVSERQMRNLLGMGIHPDAERIQADLVAQGLSVPAAAAAARLGQAFPVYDGPVEWHRRLAEAYADWNQALGRLPGERVPEGDRARIRTDLAREMFAEQHHRDPATGQELTGFLRRMSRPARSAVAGFDLTFSPVKSVSTLWAVAPRAVSERVEAAHHAAVAATLSWLEKQVGYTRVGTGGPAQVDTRGLVMAQFTHRDSRAGDPDLHTHVAVSNKVQTLDGRWLALDARMLYRFNVAGSEYYNTAMEAELTQALGVTFTERPGESGKRPVREITGVEPRLNHQWSSRASAITATNTRLQGRFLADHGRVPTTVEMISLRQQANLSTRRAKHEPRSLNEQRAQWRDEALEVLGGRRALDTMITTVLGRPVEPPSAVDVSVVEELAAATVATVAAHRAQWRESNVYAEALRVIRGRFTDTAQVRQVAEAVTARVVAGDYSVPIGMDTEIPGDRPAELTRVDGESVYRVAKAQLYSSPSVLDAEARIVAAAGRVDGRRVSAADVALAELEWSANTGGRVLNTGQGVMVRDIATSGRRVQLALAPAGTGKTTVMGVLAAAWRNGGGSIVGLAPQASAAQELGAAIPGVPADTLDKLVHDLTTAPPERWQPWMTGINDTSLVIIDEAGLASTPKLDAAIGFVLARGGRVLLVGDDRQRAATGAGGVLRDIETAHGAVTLTEVLRFTDPTEGHASLALRAGDPSAVGFYADRSRVHAVTGDTAADAVYAGWAADVAAGVESVMIAPTLEMVARLNARARADRITAAGGVIGPEVTLPNGERVSAGDTVITKRNKRTLSMGGTDFVRNNYRWTVQKVYPDGSLLATEIGRGVTRILPAWYVTAGHLRLGYAYTHASVQGMTVGAAHRRAGTAHTVVTDRMTRQDLYPTLTRAADGTHAYVILGGDGNPDEVITPDALQPPTAIEVLTAVIGRDGAARSATTEIRDAHDPALRLGHAAAAYVHAIMVGAVTVLGPDRVAAITTGAEQAVPGVTGAPAWETLLGHLAVLALDGHDPITLLADAAAARELASADDVAAVLDYRLDPTGNHSQRPGPLPWIPDIPAALAETPVWNGYLAARGVLITDLVTDLTTQVRGWTRLDAPAWAVPYLADRDLLVVLAVWRAVNAVNVDDLRPAGDRPRRIALRHRHRDLVTRCLAVAGGRDDGADRWTRVLAEHGADLNAVLADEFWPVLVGRLNIAESAGMPVRGLLAAAAQAGPLPVEQTAAALWWRLAPHLGPVATADDATGGGPRLRPTWTRVLTDALGDLVAERIVTDRLWPTLVARVDAAARAGHGPASLVSDAAGMLAAALDTVPDHDWATVLLWHIALLTDPAPVDEESAHPDPADADRYPPADLHDPARTAPRTPTGRPAGDENRRPAGDLDAPPDIDESLPLDPVDADNVAGDDAEPGVDEGRVLAALAAAAAFYTAAAARSWVPAYLTGRGLPATAAGYAPATWTALVDHLRAAGHTDQEILAAGLARHSSRGGLIDFFHHRAVLPITRPQDGSVVGFIGRKHPDDTNDRAPKYLNSPTTMVFRKSDVPFGLTPRQVAALRAGADLVLVEGPMDALAVNLARPDLVAVAPLGTALTAGHLATLNDIAPLAGRRVILLLDSDAAGRAASARAWRTLADASVSDADTITLDEGKDPAELLATRGPGALAAALQKRYPLADLVVDETCRRWTAGNDFVEHRLNALRDAAALIGAMPPEQQTRQASRLADRLRLDYLTVIDAILDHVPPDHDAVAPDPADPLGMPTRPTLTTDPPPDRGRDRSELADRWRQEQHRHARISTVAALLADVWADRPELAHRVGNAAAIGAIADQVERLQQQGLDARQVLADLPTTDLDLVDDPAAYTADLLIDHAAAHAVDDADLSRVAEIITRTWHDATDLARHVIEDPRFPTTVRAIIEAERNGLDVADLLAEVPRDTLAAVGEKARYAAHAVRVAASAHPQPDRGWDPYPADDLTWHLDGAADVLREAWRQHPDAAEKVVTGPGFDLLADRMAQAQQAGLDAATLLETVDPDKIAAAEVPSPAGITAAALTRAAADARIPAWTEREYGHLTDETLTDELARARQRLDAAVAGQAAAAAEAKLLAEAAAAGCGPAVTRLDHEMAELHRTAEELARHSSLEADWRTAIQTAQAAAAAAAIAEHERNQLRARAHRRRAELDTRITELHRQKAEALQVAAAAAEVASTLNRVPKDQGERERIAERISTADALRLRQRGAALTKDIESAERITLRATADPDRSALDRLDAELRTRTELSPPRKRQEAIERDAQSVAPAHSPEIARLPGVEYQITNAQPGSIDPPVASPSVQPGI